MLQVSTPVVNKQSAMLLLKMLNIDIRLTNMALPRMCKIVAKQKRIIHYVAYSKIIWFYVLTVMDTLFVGIILKVETKIVKYKGVLEIVGSRLNEFWSNSDLLQTSKTDTGINNLKLKQITHLICFNLKWYAE